MIAKAPKLFLAALGFVSACSAGRGTEAPVSVTPVEDASEKESQRPAEVRYVGGTFELAGREFEYYFSIHPDSESESGWRAEISMPSRAVDAMDAHVVRVEGEEVEILWKLSGIRWSWKPGDRDWECSVFQGEGEFPCDMEVLDREDFEELRTPNRPQHPKGPFDYREEAFALDRPADEGRPETAAHFEGTLTLPKDGGPFPAVILISGSGAQDRDETLFGHKPFWVLADHLTKQGFAVLRVDDRGVGGSTGGSGDVDSWDFANDYDLIFRTLREHSEIDGARVGFLGHSEGGNVGPMVAAQNPDVAFVVIWAGLGVSGSELLLLQGDLIRRKLGMSEEEVLEQRRLNETIHRHILALPLEADPSDAVRAAIEEVDAGSQEDERLSEDQKEGLHKEYMKAFRTRWFRSFIRTDAKQYLPKVRCPVLVLNGSLDLQVDAEQNVPAIEKLLKQGGNDRVETHVLPNLNHLFQPAVTGLVNEYAQIELTTDPKVLELTSNWLKALP